MGLLSWLFPSRADRVARARMLIDERRFDEAEALLDNIGGEGLEEVYELLDKRRGSSSEKPTVPQRAQVAPKPTKKQRKRAQGAGVSLDFHSDGVVIVKTSGTGDTFAINKPVEEHEAPFSDDAAEVARAVADHFAKEPLGRDGEYAFVDCVTWLDREGRAMPKMKKKGRAALAAIACAARTGDLERAVAAMPEAQTPEFRAALEVYLGLLFVDRDPRALAERVRKGELPHANTAALLERLGAIDPGLALALCGRAVPSLHHELLIGALLAAIDAGKSDAALRQRWVDLKSDAKPWRNGELRRLAREDLDAAGALFTALEQLGELEVDAASTYLTRLARVDAQRALSLAVREERSGADDLPRLAACHRGGVDVAPLLPEYIETLTADAYQTHVAFRYLVDLHMELEHEAGLEATLARAGAHGWQTTLAAHHATRALATRGSQTLPALLERLSAKRDAGPVAARDASAGGLKAGHVEYRPEWIAFTRPRPIETLRVVAALGADCPSWGQRRID